MGVWPGKYDRDSEEARMGVEGLESRILTFVSFRQGW